MKTTEHIAWENLNKRIEHLQQFPGNRSSMAKTEKLIRDAWEFAVMERDKRQIKV